MTDKNGHQLLDDNYMPILSREYYFKRENGSIVVIQDHSAGHKFGAPGGVGDESSHFNVRPPENTRTGKVSGTKPHYNFER